MHHHSHDDNPVVKSDDCSYYEDDVNALSCLDSNHHYDAVDPSWAIEFYQLID